MIKKQFMVMMALTFFSLNIAATENSNDFWYGMFTKKKINDTYSWWTEAQLRGDVDDSRVQQTLFRTGLLKDAGSWGGVGFLYAYIEARENKEHRFALQHTKAYGMVGSFNASHRIRLELRTREDQPKLAERFRYLVRFQHDTESKWAAVVWNEAFLNLEKEPNTGNRLFERNRLFLGYRYKKAKDFNLEFGYLNQYVPRETVDSMEHTLVAYVFF